MFAASAMCNKGRLGALLRGEYSLKAGHESAKDFKSAVSESSSSAPGARTRATEREGEFMVRQKWSKVTLGGHKSHQKGDKRHEA